MFGSTEVNIEGWKAERVLSGHDSGGFITHVKGESSQMEQTSLKSLGRRTTRISPASLWMVALWYMTRVLLNVSSKYQVMIAQLRVLALIQLVITSLQHQMIVV